MTQSRRMSLIEAATNVIVGYALAVGMQIVVFPVFGIHIALGDQLSIGLPSQPFRWCEDMCCAGCSRDSVDGKSAVLYRLPKRRLGSEL